MKSMTKVVRGILGYHSQRNPRAIQTADNLYRDLGLTALGLVLVVSDVEDMENIKIPIERLSSLQTVGDLFTFVSDAVAKEHRGGTDAGLA